MKPSTLLFCLAPTAALVAAEPVPHAVAPSPSLQNGSPSRPLSDVQTTPEDVPQIRSETQQMLHLQVADTQVKGDTIAIPLLRRTALSLRTRRSSTELTKRSEGTLGQTPWIGMAIGLTCTTMAAVMLGPCIEGLLTVFLYLILKPVRGILSLQLSAAIYKIWRGSEYLREQGAETRSHAVASKNVQSMIKSTSELTILSSRLTSSSIRQAPSSFRPASSAEADKESLQRSRDRMSTSTNTIINAHNNIPPEIPSSSVPIARELGILFGFLLASLVIMGVYAVIWRGIERAEEEKDRVRRERLVAQGVHHGRGGIHEKMFNQDVLIGRPEGLRSDGVHRTGDGDERARRNGAGGIGGGRTRSMSNQLAI
ncbi:uncharacterized protein BDW70DRAFT_150722 [Aspergillus foveolatus]|uniref:uncharacterized protein n=1 Tax=Aspergillus foveolatus TaxID=210207 RepID=UPI003CCD28DF